MANCAFGRGRHFACDSVATTTLAKSTGEVVQLCEFHHNILIKFVKELADGELGEDWESEASHWLVKNKIPS